jgi:Reverse transcriptase (RNA-dependent DNA polymerase)
VRSAKKDAEFEANFIEDMALAGIMHEEEDPWSFTEVLKGPNGPIWQLGMDSELESMAKHHVWDLIPQSSVPVGKKVIKSKMVCHIKRDESGKMSKLKVHIVAKGVTQIVGQDYHDTFSPVACLESFRVVLALAATLNWEIRQLDVKTAFLHSDLEEEIYMEPAEGSVVKGKC